MIEWKDTSKSARHESFRCENEDFVCDVWAVFSWYMQYRYTVYDKIKSTYIAGGLKDTLDEACESALKEIRI